MNQIIPQNKPSNADIVSTGTSSDLTPTDLAQAMQFAKVMSTANVGLPKYLRGDEGSCLSIVMQALRWGLDPFSVAQKSYFVNDKIAFEAQLIAAIVNTRAKTKGPLKYVFSGEGGQKVCTVTGILNGEECSYTTPIISQISPKNSPLWKTDPEQQLAYYAVKSWARRHCPDVILGVYDRDELSQSRDITPAYDDKPTILQSLNKDNKEYANEGFNLKHITDETDTISTVEVVSNVSEPDALGSKDDSDASGDDVMEADVVGHEFDETTFYIELASAVIKAAAEDEKSVVETSKLYAGGNLTPEQSEKARAIVIIAKSVGRKELSSEDGIKRIAGVIGVDYRLILEENNTAKVQNNSVNLDAWIGKLAQQLFGAIGDDIDDYDLIADRIFPTEMMNELPKDYANRGESIYRYGLQACKKEIDRDTARKLMAGVAHIPVEDMPK